MRYSIIIPCADPANINLQSRAELQRAMQPLPGDWELLGTQPHEQSLIASLAAAQGDCVIVIDPSLPYSFVQIALLTQRLARADFVCGRRRRRGVAKLIERVARIPRWFLLGLDSHDPGCMFWAARREVFAGLVLQPHLLRYLPSLVARRGYRVDQVYVTADRQQLPTQLLSQKYAVSPLNLIRAAWTCWTWREPSADGSIDVSRTESSNAHPQILVIDSHRTSNRPILSEPARKKSA